MADKDEGALATLLQKALNAWNDFKKPNPPSEDDLLDEWRAAGGTRSGLRPGEQGPVSPVEYLVRQGAYAPGTYNQQRESFYKELEKPEYQESGQFGLSDDVVKRGREEGVAPDNMPTEYLPPSEYVRRVKFKK